MVVVLDSGGVTFLAERSTRALAMIETLQRRSRWPPIVPSVVLIESLRGHAGHDARTNRLLKSCEIVQAIPVDLARRAAALRRLAGRGSAVDALVVAIAEPGGSVLTSDARDIRALAAHAKDVLVERI